MIFNIVADMLAIMIERAKFDGQIEGVIPYLIDKGLSIIQYADDSILFIKHNLEKRFKLILSSFEQLLGLKINFHKNELFCFGEAQDHTQLYAESFRCNHGQFPIRYLYIPIHFLRLINVEWKIMEERLQLRFSSWKGKLLSIGGRLVPLVSFFLLPKGVLNRWYFFQTRFFWQGNSKKKKYRLAKRSVVCRSKDQEGLGIQDLEVKNTALLGKWLFRLLTEEEIWQTLLKRKNILVRKCYQMMHTFGLDL
jgi:hypothetical protein